MVKPDFWFMFISEVVVAGLCIYFFYIIFLKPNAKSRKEEMEERIRRRQEAEEDTSEK